jgi:hypothetical protein
MPYSKTRDPVRFYTARESQGGCDVASRPVTRYVFNAGVLAKLGMHFDACIKDQFRTGNFGIVRSIASATRILNDDRNTPRFYDANTIGSVFKRERARAEAVGKLTHFSGMRDTLWRPRPECRSAFPGRRQAKSQTYLADRAIVSSIP